ncbi:MAG TPA: multicopper oxidase domain-containing protein [Vicinamibacterales bacterium]|nr:multicopper oxidase domain-containing protein [Vicinamibacterales bacterium]
MNTMSRRELLATAGVALAVSTTACRRQEQPSEPDTPSVTLECAEINKELAGRQVKLRAFNGTVPGPMLTCRPGQLLRVTVKNSLPRYNSTGWPGNHNVPHAIGSMNLHLHGLDIEPHLFEPPGTTNATATMIDIEAGASRDYSFQIPDDHPPGLYWYHSHHHGSTAVQAVSGMAGGVIVAGDIDEVPAIKAARDLPLVIQDIGLFPGPTDADPWSYDFEQNAIWQTFDGNVTKYNPATGKQEVTTLKSGFTTGDYPLRFFLLNGEPFFQEVHNSTTPTSPSGTQLTPPQITVAPGEVVRFRMLNACSDNLMPIVVDGHELHLLALDGVNFPQVRVLPVYTSSTGQGQVQLAPANRAEFMIKAVATPGTYAIRQLAQMDQFLASDAKVIAEIVVSGAAKDMALPTALPVQGRYFPVDPNRPIKNVRNILFSGTFPPQVNPYVGIDFTINNNSYDEAAVQQVVTVGSTEIWNLEVFGQHHGGTEGHPFHIHVNHFEPLTLTDNTDPTKPVVTNYPAGTFLDTIWVPAKSVVTIRMHFKQWKGKTVYHCHILPHEDTGMMQNFLIV